MNPVKSISDISTRRTRFHSPIKISMVLPCKLHKPVDMWYRYFNKITLGFYLLLLRYLKYFPSRVIQFVLRFHLSLLFFSPFAENVAIFSQKKI